jgi:hypothetical protein
VAAAKRNCELQTISQLFIEFACLGLNNLWNAETQISSFILFITHFSVLWTLHMGRWHHLQPPNYASEFRLVSFMLFFSYVYGYAVVTCDECNRYQSIGNREYAVCRKDNVQ